jgi:hypothetical protein
VNAITAVLCGAVPGIILARVLYHSPAPAVWLAGILAGSLWANGFEYCYHRFLLHWPKCSFGKGHLEHHMTSGTPEEPEHLPFGSSPLLVAAVFLVNGCVAVIVGRWLHLAIAPGILTGFSLYMIAVEEIHWRIHRGEWLPLGLNWTREYHLAHHDIPSGRYNVFFPAFDFLFSSVRPPLRETQAATMVAVTGGCESSVPSWLGVTCSLLWIWTAVLAVCARYVWTSRPQP